MSSTMRWKELKERYQPAFLMNLDMKTLHLDAEPMRYGFDLPPETPNFHDSSRQQIPFDSNSTSAHILKHNESHDFIKNELAVDLKLLPSENRSLVIRCLTHPIIKKCLLIIGLICLISALVIMIILLSIFFNTNYYRENSEQTTLNNTQIP